MNNNLLDIIIKSFESKDDNVNQIIKSELIKLDSKCLIEYLLKFIDKNDIINLLIDKVEPNLLLKQMLITKTPEAKNKLADYDPCSGGMITTIKGIRSC